MFFFNIINLLRVLYVMTKCSKPGMVSNVFHFMSIWLRSKHLVLSHLTLLLQSPTELLPLSLYKLFCTVWLLLNDLAVFSMNCKTVHLIFGISNVPMVYYMYYICVIPCHRCLDQFLRDEVTLPKLRTVHIWYLHGQIIMQFNHKC